MPQYRRLTQGQRHLIEAGLLGGAVRADIARKAKCSESTICREVKRNGKDGRYDARNAQGQSDERRRRCRRRRTIDERTARAFEQSLRNGLSPELFSGRLRRKWRGAPSTSTFYRFARSTGISRTLLPRSGCRGAGRYIQRQCSVSRLSVHTRPKAAMSRRTIGHWERDTLYAANRRLVLVLIERKSRLVMLEVLRERTADEAAAATRRLLKRARLPVKSITNDNGPEFRGHAPLPAPVYFSDPGKPGQRGSVENVIRLLRRHFPRTADLNTFTRKDILRIEKWANERPRKCLNFQKPLEIVRNERLRWQ